MTAEQFTLKLLKLTILGTLVYAGFVIGRISKEPEFDTTTEAGDYNIYLGEQIYIVDPEKNDTILIESFDSGSELSKAILKDNE